MEERNELHEKKYDYHIERFSQEQILLMQNTFYTLASDVGGLPRNADEVFEKRGWLQVFLLAYDQLLWGRWNYWLDILAKGTIEGSQPIPQIRWSDPCSPGVIETFKMFGRCLNHFESTIEKFADWLLWGHGLTNEAPKISKELNRHYYRNFDLFLVLDNPTDYFSQLLCEETSKGYKAGLGYFPTPFSLAQLMVALMVDNVEQMKRKTVYEPCVGCGALLLPMSNYVFRAYAQDVSLIAIKLCKIQFIWYAPWFAAPGEHLKGFDQDDVIELPDRRMLDGLNWYENSAVSV